MVFIALTLSIFLAACGGSSSSKTPASTYTLTVTAAAGSLHTSTILRLIVREERIGVFSFRQALYSMASVTRRQSAQPFQSTRVCKEDVSIYSDPQPVFDSVSGL